MDENKTKCLVCQQTTKRMTRGLCQSHYQQFTRQRKEMVDKDGEEVAQEWEDWLIKNGKVLPVNQGKKPDVQNEFAELQQQFRRQKAKELRESVQAKVSQDAKKTKP